MLNDVKYAIRAYLRTPGFTTVAVLTLALGIGATTAMFSLVNAVLLQPLPYAAAERLVVARVSLPEYHDVRRSARTFDGMGLWASNQYNLGTESGAQQVLGGVVSRDLFPLLGVQPALGRNFTEADDREDTVILAYGLWQGRYGGDPAVLGRTIDLSGTRYTVVGVAPAWFRFPSAEFQVWTPLGGIEAKAPQQAANRALRIFTLVGRIKEGTTIAQARSELAILSEELARTHPATNANVTIAPTPLYEQIVGASRPALLFMLGTVALLLLIACANVANLLLARTNVREREIAVRAALGAGRGRIVRQLITESLVLAAAGAFLGLLVTLWGVDALPALLEARLPRAEAVRVDGVVLLFALVATLATALLFGSAPALQTMRRAVTLKDGGRSVAGTARARRLRHAIVVGEVALALVVIVGAALLMRSFAKLTAQDPGFRAAGLLGYSVQFLKQPGPEARAQAAAAMLERVRALPGVSVAGGATGLPAVTPQRSTRFELDGRTLPANQDRALFMAVTAGYFQALDTRVLQGRAIAETDRRGTEPVAIVSRTFAERLFPGEDPVGRRLRLINPEYPSDWRTIVGIVDDVQYREPDAAMAPAIYTPFTQTPFLWLYVMVRPAGDGAGLMRAIPAAVAADPTVTAANLRRMEELVSEAAAEPRFNMALTTAFAALALLLAAVGIYGVIAYSVTQRTQEIGIRLALGAASRDVMRLVLREGLLMAGVGVAIGLAAAAAVTRGMQTMLFAVSPTDPAAFAAAGALLMLVAVAATYIPARRAVRVNPIHALRAE